MQPAVQLREKLNRSELVLGVLVAQHVWPDLIEMAMAARLDYLVLDMEHLDHGGARVAEVCAMARVAGFAVLVRPPSVELTYIRLAMDIGPCGLLLPMVETPQQLDVARDGIYIPPRGQRRPGGPGNRWLRQYDYQTFKTEIEDHLIVVPLIESVPGLDNADAIAAHPITTALGIGPFDLSARLGVCGQPDHPKMLEAQQRIADAAKRAGKPAWMMGEAISLIRRGYRFLCIGEASGMLQSAMSNAVRLAHGNAAGGPVAPHAG
jgi:2-keto-3-deoxy-L-rhamnonate aldolase RhmA